MLVRTRFAPSPTGTLHLGSIRTALFCWLFARHHGGKFILRIEDTDPARSTKENVDAIVDGIAWINIDVDEGPIFQSQRCARYDEVLAKLLEEGKAYHCNCTKEDLAALRERQMLAGEMVGYDGRCRDRKASKSGTNSVVRFRNPQDGLVVVDDQVRGRVIFDNAQLDDLIIARSDGTPTYNFSVVVDDADMGITHVIRGDDHLNNTPRQVNIFNAIGVDPPIFAHLPMILGNDGAKLSKRHGAVDIRAYREMGYLPEAMLNYLVRLGWSHGDKEIFTIDEMISLFDIADVNQSASAFNPEKLLWINQQHIIAASSERLGKELVPYLKAIGLNPKNGPNPKLVAKGFKERAETLAQMAASARYCYEDFDEIDLKSAKKHLRPVARDSLVAVMNNLSRLNEWTKDAISKVIDETATQFEIKMGKLGQPIRVAVTGGPVSPPIDVTLELVGQERTICRLRHAIDYIERRCADLESEEQR